MHNFEAGADTHSSLDFGSLSEQLMNKLNESPIEAQIQHSKESNSKSLPHFELVDSTDSTDSSESEKSQESNSLSKSMQKESVIKACDAKPKPVEKDTQIKQDKLGKKQEERSKPIQKAEDSESRSTVAKYFHEIAADDSMISKQELDNFIRDNQRYTSTGKLEHDPNSPISESEYADLMRAAKDFKRTVTRSDDQWGRETEISWSDLAPEQLNKRSRIPDAGTIHLLSNR